MTGAEVSVCYPRVRLRQNELQQSITRGRIVLHVKAIVTLASELTSPNFVRLIGPADILKYLLCHPCAIPPGQRCSASIGGVCFTHSEIRELHVVPVVVISSRPSHLDARIHVEQIFRG